MNIRQQLIQEQVIGYTFTLNSYRIKNVKQDVAKFLELSGTGEYHVSLILPLPRFGKKEIKFLNRVENILRKYNRIDVNLINIRSFSAINTFRNVRAKEIYCDFSSLLILSRVNKVDYLQTLEQIYRISKDAEIVKYSMDASFDRTFVEHLPVKSVRDASLILDLTGKLPVTFHSWMLKVSITQITMNFPFLVKSMLHLKRVFGRDRTTKKITLLFKPRLYGDFYKIQLFLLFLLRENVDFAVRNRCHISLRSQIKDKHTLKLLSYCFALYFRKSSNVNLTEDLLNTSKFIFLTDLISILPSVTPPEEENNRTIRSSSGWEQA